ncbi:MAG: T9SS type A sorting domain-containing protein [Bacteroidota bacterium]
MKFLHSLCILVLFSSALDAQQHQTLKVLFLGNSYTAVNNLPQLIKDIALANGDTLLFDSHCPGGQTFQGHSTDPTSISKINAQAWDRVVLQAQSQEPSFPPSQVNSQTLPYAIKLDSMIQHNNTCTETVFYETWGRKNGDASNCGFYPPLCTYTGMQNRLKISYKLFADTTHSIMAPAGEAWRKSIALNPGLELYSSDQSHPSMEGSYLTACVFYEVLFHKSVLTNTYTAGISTGTVSFLQQIAHDVVNDSLMIWNIGKHNAYAPFTKTYLSGTDFQFNSSSPLFSNQWYFGDGGTSTSINPIHTFAVNQMFTVSHVVTNACGKDSSTLFFDTFLSRIPSIDNTESLAVYPNPANDVLYTSSKMNYKIYDVLGKLCLSGKNSSSVNIESLKSGVYFIEFPSLNSTKKLKFMKE